MSWLVWGLEWRLALAGRRLFVLNTLVPLLLVVPIATGAAPAVHAAAVYAVLFVMFGVFGSAIPLVRNGERGITARVLRGGVGPSSYLLQRTAAGAVLDVVQLTPALAVVALGAGVSALPLLVAYGALAATAWVTGLIGVVIAAATRSMAEAALFSAVSALLLLHMSGVFRTPPPGSYGALFEVASPFRLLHEALAGISLGTPVGGVGSAAGWTTALAVLVALLGGPLTRSLGRSQRS